MCKNFRFQIPAPFLMGFGIFSPKTAWQCWKCWDLGHGKSEGLEFFIWDFYLFWGLGSRNVNSHPAVPMGKKRDFWESWEPGGGIIVESQSSRLGWVGMELKIISFHGLGEFLLSQLAPARPWTFQGCGKWDGRIPDCWELTERGGRDEHSLFQCGKSDGENAAAGTGNINKLSWNSCCNPGLLFPGKGQL